MHDSDMVLQWRPRKLAQVSEALNSFPVRALCAMLGEGIYFC